MKQDSPDVTRGNPVISTPETDAAKDDIGF